MAYAEIDWHDFVIVETVDFPAHERSDLPPPVTKEQLGVRLTRQKRLEEFGSEETDRQRQMQREQEQQMQQAAEEEQAARAEPQIVEKDLGEQVLEKPKAPQVNSAPVVSQTRSDVVIRTGYDPKTSRKAKFVPGDTEYLISPLTGERIPASKMDEHMRIGLLDPAWVEKRNRLPFNHVKITKISVEMTVKMVQNDRKIVSHEKKIGYSTKER